MEIPALSLPPVGAGAAVGLVLVKFLAKGKPEPASIRLVPAQRAAIQDHFDNGPTLAGSYGWSRRQYAPMPIPSTAFASIVRVSSSPS